MFALLAAVELIKLDFNPIFEPGEPLVRVDDDRLTVDVADVLYSDSAVCGEHLDLAVGASTFENTDRACDYPLYFGDLAQFVD